MQPSTTCAALLQWLFASQIDFESGGLLQEQIAWIYVAVGTDLQVDRLVACSRNLHRERRITVAVIDILVGHPASNQFDCMPADIVYVFYDCLYGSGFVASLDSLKNREMIFQGLCCLGRILQALCSI